MNGKIMAAVAVLAVGIGALIWSMSRSAGGSAGSIETYWLCQSCNHSFGMTKHELGKWQEQHYGEALKCPNCGSDKTVKAYKCPQCGDVFAVHAVTKCPKCGAAVTNAG